MRNFTDNENLLRIEEINPITKYYKIRFDFKEEEEGVYSYEEFDYYGIIDLSNIKYEILNYYNKLCDNEILSGLKYNNSTVWLSSENQFNYKSAWDFALNKNGMNLPVTFNLGDNDNPVYETFSTIEELDGFMITVMVYIQTTLVKYWNIKDRIDWSLYIIDE